MGSADHTLVWGSHRLDVHVSSLDKGRTRNLTILLPNGTITIWAFPLGTRAITQQLEEPRETSGEGCWWEANGAVTAEDRPTHRNQHVAEERDWEAEVSPHNCTWLLNSASCSRNKEHCSWILKKLSSAAPGWRCQITEMRANTTVYTPCGSREIFCNKRMWSSMFINLATKAHSAQILDSCLFPRKP